MEKEGAFNVQLEAIIEQARQFNPSFKVELGKGSKFDSRTNTIILDEGLVKENDPKVFPHFIEELYHSLFKQALQDEDINRQIYYLRTVTAWRFGIINVEESNSLIQYYGLNNIEQDMKDTFNSLSDKMKEKLTYHLSSNVEFAGGLGQNDIYDILRKVSVTGNPQSGIKGKFFELIKKITDFIKKMLYIAPQNSERGIRWRVND